jgi:hypothetical protein
MNPTRPPKSTPRALVLLFWLYVATPLTWGIWSTLKKAMALFN